MPEQVLSRVHFIYSYSQTLSRKHIYSKHANFLLMNFSLYREEKSLHHITMVAQFLDDNKL